MNETGSPKVLLVDVSDRGGIARYTGKLRTALEAEGAWVARAGPAGVGDPGLVLGSRKWGPDVTGGARTLVLGRRAAEVVPSAWLFGRAVMKARCEVVHVQTEVVPGIDHLVLGAIAKRVPVVVTAHDPDPLEGGARALEKEARRWRAANAVIIHGEGPRELVESRAPGVPVYVVPVDLALGGPGVEKAEARSKLGLGAGPTALLLGLIRPYKGLDILVEAWPKVMAQIPEARLVVVGEPYRCGELERLEEMEGVEVRKGFVSEEDFDLWAAAPDVLVLPYHRGSHSGILHRGVGAGTPVLASPSLADEVRRTRAGRVVALEPEAWAEALVETLGGHPPAVGGSGNGEGTALGTLAVYREVLSRVKIRA